MFPDWLTEAVGKGCDSVGLYIHVPFCRRACHYCDFYFTPRASLMEDYTDALLREVEIYRPLLETCRIETIFFGGGTPSWLPLPLWEKIFRRLHQLSTCQPAEITIEANPEDITPSNLAFWTGHGVSRISIGIQSFSEKVLQQLGRWHSPRAAMEALSHLQKASLRSWNADLIFGVPEQQVDDLLKDLDIIIAAGTPHLSLYGLTIEPRTVLFKKVQLGRMLPISDEEYAAHYLAAHTFLQERGYMWYEISNWALPSYECMHNQRYWERKPYIGLGPSAHSYIPETRWNNVQSIRHYIESLSKGVLPVEHYEQLGEEEIREEMWLTRLRTQAGISLEVLPGITEDALLHLVEIMSSFENQGWIRRQANTYFLTPQGALVSDYLLLQIELVITSLSHNYAANSRS